MRPATSTVLLLHLLYLDLLFEDLPCAHVEDLLHHTRHGHLHMYILVGLARVDLHIV